MRVSDRRDLLQYIRRLEEAIIRTLAHFDISGGRIAGLSGVWIGTEKIAAIGVKMGRVTSHGFALNVTTDMSYFDHIIPCGIRGKGVTSMAQQVRSAPTVRAVADVVAVEFAEVFGSGGRSAWRDASTFIGSTQRDEIQQAP